MERSGDSSIPGRQLKERLVPTCNAGVPENNAVKAGQLDTCASAFTSAVSR